MMTEVRFIVSGDNKQTYKRCLLVKWYIMLLAYPWRYKHYANATQVMRTMPILLSLHISESLMVYAFYYPGNNEISVFTISRLHCRATTCS